ncbi:hypothetical protein ACLB2K_068124 [Fragaria x ananassa]
MDPKDPKFWNWSFDELVAHDLPAVFDYVHGQTKQKINYIGHSLGTLLALASLSEGKLVDQLKSVALLSPVAYLTYMSTPIGAVGARLFAGEITRIFGFAEFDPKGEPVATLIDHICATAGVPCYDLLAILTGKNCCLNASTVDLFLDHEPQPTSTKTMTQPISSSPFHQTISVTTHHHHHHIKRREAVEAPGWAIGTEARVAQLGDKEAGSGPGRSGEQGRWWLETFSGVDNAGSEAQSWSTAAGSKVDEGGDAPDRGENGSVGGDAPVEFAADGFGIQREPGRLGVLGAALKVGGVGLVEDFVRANWVSLPDLVWWNLVVRTGVIAKFDYGSFDTNYMHYRSFSPPHYDLSKIPTSMPMFISYGGQDALSDELDVLRLLEHLKYHDKGKLVVDFIHEYAHADFVMGINAKDLVYNKVISFMKQQQ